MTRPPQTSECQSLHNVIFHLYIYSGLRECGTPTPDIWVSEFGKRGGVSSPPSPSGGRGKGHLALVVCVADSEGEK